ncbi:MAG: DUF6142 family protein [Lachnospiraceae bacterium]|nr:DUF6142 family protein [Lachnospiraceae bacterium]MDD7026161.1 DUF6142 family protein [Lachnospiraceae bacterium]MDY5699547.1 DUF6142 family protein [Lachnospiraceae bacterium]
MEKKKNYMFTNKKHSSRGIMSAILGTISLVSLGLAVFQTYQVKGEAGGNMGTVGFVATCFSITGLTLGILSKTEADRFRLFPYLGIVLNLLALMATSTILYAGAYGIG